MFRISNIKRNDSPFLKKLLKPFRFLGLVIADKGYSGKKNAEFVANKKGAFFSPFKSNVEGKGMSLWTNLFKLWKVLVMRFIAYNVRIIIGIQIARFCKVLYSYFELVSEQ